MILRIVIADDERPARMFLKNLLEGFDDVEIVGEAETGAEAVEIIERTKPDLALLDLQMPELTGLQVVKVLKKNVLPLVAFVTAYDEFAVRAFEINAVDYLLKPIEKSRLRETLNRAQERLENDSLKTIEAANLNAAVTIYEETTRQNPLERIPIRVKDEIILLPTREVVSIVADGELLHIVTVRNEKYTINFRLKDLETRLDATKFVRLSRGTLVNIEFVSKLSPMPGGTYVVTLKNNQQLSVSRLQSRILREQLLRL
ncbi:MAG: response regulator [Pyrinomonadaceae bacterium]|nr:response regulator [Pyrinomonadaceae bacterium]